MWAYSFNTVIYHRLLTLRLPLKVYTVSKNLFPYGEMNGVFSSWTLYFYRTISVATVRLPWSPPSAQPLTTTRRRCRRCVTPTERRESWTTPWSMRTPTPASSGSSGRRWRSWKCSSLRLRWAETSDESLTQGFSIF